MIDFLNWRIDGFLGCLIVELLAWRIVGLMESWLGELTDGLLAGCIIDYNCYILIVTFVF